MTNQREGQTNERDKPTGMTNQREGQTNERDKPTGMANVKDQKTGNRQNAVKRINAFFFRQAPGFLNSSCPDVCTP